MITGFNTDIEFQGITYHVQTEDKGIDTPLILSLVYNRGTILASKRSPYNDLLAETFDEKELTERLQKQHKLMCAAVRAGRIEDLKRMTMKDSASRHKGLVTQKEIKKAVEEKPIVFQQPETISLKSEEKPTVFQKPEAAPQKQENFLPPVFKDNSRPVSQPNKITNDLPKLELREKPVLPILREKVEEKIPKPKEDLVWDIPINIVEENFVEAIHIVEEEIILPAEAVEIITDSTKIEQVADYNLKIELLSEVIFRSGERKTISILVFRGNRETGLSGAQVIVKVIGTSFRPLIFHAKTDSNGVATVHLQLPQFKAGRAAVLIRAMSENEETELRRVIEPS